MKHNYEIEIKAESGGRKSVVIKLNGKVIGKRTSARIYRFALVVTGNQAYSLKNAVEGLAHQKKQVARYQAIVDDAPGARNNFIMFNDTLKPRLNSMESQQWHRQFIDNGEVAKWLAHAKESIVRLTSEIAKLSSGPQPEFSQPSIASWHQQRKSVPAVREWHRFYDVIEIPVSEQIDAVDSQIDASASPKGYSRANTRQGLDA